VLDDYSPDIIAWSRRRAQLNLCTNKRDENVTYMSDLGLKASGRDHATVLHKPRLLSDNGPSYIASELAECIEAQQMTQLRGASLHPQTQGKIERWHQTLKTAFCWRTASCPVTSRPKSRPSSSTTTTSVITRAWTS
jgi:putative transposase